MPCWLEGECGCPSWGASPHWGRCGCPHPGLTCAPPHLLPFRRKVVDKGEAPVPKKEEGSSQVRGREGRTAPPPASPPTSKTLRTPEGVFPATSPARNHQPGKTRLPLGWKQDWPRGPGRRRPSPRSQVPPDWPAELL